MLTRYLSGGLIPLPHILTLELTSFCNLNCVMCPRTAGAVNTPRNRVLPMEIVDRLESIFSALDGVDLSGLWGEAFLHPQLYIEILRRLKERHIGVRTVTNGTLITEEIAEEIVALGLDGLEISIDAAKPETYRKIRRGGELDSVLRGIRAVNSAKKKLGREFPAIKLLFLGMTDNIAELPDFVGMACSLGAKTVVLQAMGEYAEVRGKSLAGSNRELGVKWLRKARGAAEESGVAIELFPLDQFDEPPQPVRAEKTPAEKRKRLVRDCFFPWDRAVVTTTGDVIPCCSSPGSFGNLLEKSFTDIWHGEDYSRLRRSLLDGPTPEMCLHCTGQPWRGVSFGDSAACLLRIEAMRLKQKLRSCSFLMKLKRGLLK